MQRGDVLIAVATRRCTHVVSVCFCVLNVKLDRTAVATRCRLIPFFSFLSFLVAAQCQPIASQVRHYDVGSKKTATRTRNGSCERQPQTERKRDGEPRQGLERCHEANGEENVHLLCCTIHKLLCIPARIASPLPARPSPSWRRMAFGPASKRRETAGRRLPAKQNFKLGRHPSVVMRKMTTVCQREYSRGRQKSAWSCAR